MTFIESLIALAVQALVITSIFSLAKRMMDFDDTGKL
jgi:hypothetical protein